MDYKQDKDGQDLGDDKQIIDQLNHRSEIFNCTLSQLTPLMEKGMIDWTLDDGDEDDEDDKMAIHESEKPNDQPLIESYCSMKSFLTRSLRAQLSTLHYKHYEK